MWKNIVEQGRSQMKIRRMLIACWIHKDLDTHSEYVVHIAFPLQHILQQRPSTSRFKYIACLVCF